MTLRVAVVLWISARALQFVAASPWRTALGAVLLAFTVPPVAASNAEELQILTRYLQHRLWAPWEAVRSARAPAVGAAGLAVWLLSDRGTRVFLLFISAVGASHYVSRLVARHQTGGGCVSQHPAHGSRCAFSRLQRNPYDRTLPALFAPVVFSPQYCCDGDKSLIVHSGGARRGADADARGDGCDDAKEQAVEKEGVNVADRALYFRGGGLMLLLLLFCCGGCSRTRGREQE